MSDEIHLRRLFFVEKISGEVTLNEAQNHYIRNVMRMKIGDRLRLFNENDGEWLCTLSQIEKKYSSVMPVSQLRAPKNAPPRMFVMAPPLAKDRMDYMLEKATELGMTHYQPILCERSDVRKIKEERLIAQMIEASEQSERLHIPTLLPITDMKKAVLESKTPIFAAIERFGAKPVLEAFRGDKSKDVAVLIGPAGGFSEQEQEWLASQDTVIPVSLGENILRAETAIAYILAVKSAYKETIS